MSSNATTKPVKSHQIFTDSDLFSANPSFPEIKDQRSVSKPNALTLTNSSSSSIYPDPCTLTFSEEDDEETFERNRFSIEKDLFEILSFSDFSSKKKVRFKEGSRTTKRPRLRRESCLRMKLKSDSLVDRGVSSVATKLLDLSQRKPFDDGGGDGTAESPRLALPQTSDSIVLHKQKEREKVMERRRALRPKQRANRQLLSEIVTGLQSMDSLPQLFTNRVFKRQFIRHYIQQNTRNVAANDRNRFDSISVTTSNGKIVVLDSNGFSKGCHEWTVTILKTDIEAQEIGVVANGDISDIHVDSGGVLKTSSFGARSCFGSELCSSSIYYGSLNRNGQKRCFRDLTEWYSVGWCVGDQITVKIDLRRYRIRYLLNGQPVRYCMSLQPGYSYHPFISFSGNCKYSLR